ncbi:zinc finger A20 and AN1 domain-containing stress-associated protein 5-like [Camellia sinensis]|uniref:zinc finger A20 and AN1 domain-containing stress-associated protein 5-like n=1 Tax=Camellia sinensis TaxID=4442 RepID=UPI0010367A46|nr:zinc finger A20 and AN1 domain-containing stress-associated protein 5-like [Camellia sinensis]
MSESCFVRSPERLSDLTSPPPPPHHLRRARLQQPLVAAAATTAATTTATEVKRREDRCSGCKRKVGLTSFRCRCGDLFCSEHRYSDRHDCSFDYKAAGREAIARENSVVRAAKILKV